MQTLHSKYKPDKSCNSIIISMFSAPLIITLAVYIVDQIYNPRQIATSKKSQITKVIHSDYSTVAEAITSAFSTIEINQAGL